MSDADSVKKCYEVLLEEHVRLRGLLAELKQILLERSAEISEVSRRLRDLSELIDDHFKAEEESQCFAEMVSHAPHVSDRVNDLIAEHGELRAEIAGLVDLSGEDEGTAAGWEKIGGDFAQFTEKLMRHEEMENELVQFVFTEDIGSKD